jgi:hypothetical protein
MPTARAIVSRLQDLNIKGSLTVGYFLQYQTDGSFTLAAAGGNPGGSTGQIQYNNAGAFGGTVALIYSATGTLLKITAQSATDVPLTIKGASSQSGNLQEWQNSLGAVQLSIDPTGFIYGHNGTWLSLGQGGAYTITNQSFQAYGAILAGSFINLGNNAAGFSTPSAGVVKVTDGGSGAGYLQQKTGTGAPSDTPPDGSQYIDITNLKLYVRIGGAWKSVTLT